MSCCFSTNILHQQIYFSALPWSETQLHAVLTCIFPPGSQQDSRWYCFHSATEESPSVRQARQRPDLQHPNLSGDGESVHTRLTRTHGSCAWEEMDTATLPTGFDWVLCRRGDDGRQAAHHPHQRHCPVGVWLFEDQQPWNMCINLATFSIFTSDRSEFMLQWGVFSIFAFIRPSFSCYKTPAPRTRKWSRGKECHCPRTSPREETSSLPLTSNSPRNWPLRGSSWLNKPFLVKIKHIKVQVDFLL